MIDLRMHWIGYGLLLVVLGACSSPGARPSSDSPAAPGVGSEAASPQNLDPFAVVALKRDVSWLCHPDRRGRGSLTHSARLSADWVARRFEELDLEVVRQEVEGGVHNVLGLKRGGPEAVIVSAHYDHLGEGPNGQVFPGADDNASGVAALLAIASDVRARSFEGTIIFAAFGAEEVGLRGSRTYIRDPLWPLEQTRAIINFDMIGRRFFEGGAAKPHTAAVVGLEQEPEVRRVAMHAARDVGLELIAAPARLVELFGYDDRTDEWWFRRRGILAIHFSTGMHDDYHKPSDTPDKLDYGQIRRVALTAAGVLRHLAVERL